jgi:competence protein ComEC
VIVPFLRTRGINRIDRILLTHPDLDHYGGLPVLMEAYSIAQVIAPATVLGESPIWDCLRKSCLRDGVAWVEAGAGDILYRSRETELRVLGPGLSLNDAEDNDRSLVCLLSTPKEKVLLTGDIEGPGQLALADSWPLWKGAWLKAPHHGSDRTTFPCFLESIQAPVASVSAGRRPGFPGPKSMATLRKSGTHTGVTSKEGALFWEFSPDKAGAAWSFRSRAL